MNELDQIYCRVWTVNGHQDLTVHEWKMFDYRKLNRTDGPAVIFDDGTEEWYQSGKLHRTNEPAVMGSHGRKMWWQNGKLHRVDGPAVVCSDGRKEWWIKHQRLDTQQVEDWIQENSINLSTQEGQTAFVLRWP